MRLLDSWRGKQRGYTNLAPLCQPLPAGPEARRPLCDTMLPTPSLSDAQQRALGAAITEDALGFGSRLSDGIQAPRSKDLNDEAGTESPRSETSVQTADGLNSSCRVEEVWRGDPAPPPTLWDTDDVQYLDKVKCHVCVRLTHCDPKNGSYEGRMEIHWALRTLKTKDRTEPRIRVPGMRLPRLVCSVEESRIWRHFDGDSECTIAWQGTSVMSFLGYEIFEVQDFPFDRQIVTLDMIEFVWRTDKDSDIYHEAMKIVSFTLETVSMLPEWDTYAAYIEPLDIKRLGSGPEHASRFMVRLRLQRKETYYIVHVFLVSLLILGATLLPLNFVPGPGHVTDRLAIHSAGLLTLVAFKYGVSHSLPSVPYSTFISTYLTLQIVTLVFVCIEAIFAYKTVGVFINEHAMHRIEDCMLIMLLLSWGGGFCFIAFYKKRVPWEVVLDSQDENIEENRYEPMAS